MKVRDWPMPPPIDSGISSFRIAWWYGSFRKSSLAGDLELLPQRLLGDADAHRGQLVAALGDRVPDQDVAVEAVHRLAVSSRSSA